MFSHKTQIRVRYSETDQMSYVYYGNYATYYEISRSEMLRSTGISYKEIEDSGVMMPVYDMSSRFYKAAKYDDLLTVKTTIHKKPSVRICFEYEVYNQKGELLTTGSTTLVFVDMNTGKPCLPPEIFQEKMKQFFA